MRFVKRRRTQKSETRLLLFSNAPGNYGPRQLHTICKRSDQTVINDVQLQP